MLKVNIKYKYLKIQVERNKKGETSMRAFIFCFTLFEN